MNTTTPEEMAVFIEKQKARIRFVRYGECNHEEKFEETFEPYGTGRMVTCCGVCNKIKKEWYK
jgi:hypothetical protein